MVAFISLPPEIINHILYDLAPPDLLACQLTNKYLDNTIRESVILQHKLALTRAFAEDSPLSHALTSDKLASLKKIEDAWLEMRPDFSRNLAVPLRQSGVYDLTGGVYLLSNSDRTSIGLLRLPTKEGDPLDWIMQPFGKLFVDVGLCVYEHDLIAIVTSTLRPGAAGSPNTFDIALELVELSTRNSHPLAQQNPLFVMNSAWEMPSVGIEIVGKHLVLVLSFSARGHPQDRIFVFDWRTGVLVASFEARSHTYAGLIFLDELHILLPNTRSNTLDIYCIPPAPTLAPLRPVLILALPALNEGRILGFAPCRAEPNPIAKDSYPSMRMRQRPGVGDEYLDLTPERGFLLKASTALCMFHLRVHILELNIMADGGLQMGFPFRYSFTFVTQRQALLDLIDKHVPTPAEVEGANNPPSPSPSPGPLTASDSVNPVSPTPFATPLASGSTQAQSTVPMLLYDQWGPNITAWFGSNERDISPQWITTSSGRRCVRMETSMIPGGLGDRFYVCEFGGDASVLVDEAKHEGPEGSGDLRDGDGVHKDKGKGKARDDYGREDGPAGNMVPIDDGSLKPGNTEPANLSSRPWDADTSPGEGCSGHTHSDETPSTGAHDAPALPAVGEEDNEDPEGHPMVFDLWPGGQSADSYTWMQNQAFEQITGLDEEEGGSEDDDHIDAEEQVQAHAQLHQLTQDALDPHSHIEDTEEADAEDEYSDSYTHDPLPGTAEATLRVEGERELFCPDVFREPIRHNLPYIVRGSRDRYNWDGILLDEERVIGIKATEQGHVLDEIEILHFG